MDAQLDRPTIEFLEEGEGFDLANLLPEDTGLPMVVWISDGTGVRHDVRVKVREAHGDRIRTEQWAVMSVRPEPELLHGELSSRDVRAVRDWIKLNEAAILAYCDGELGTRRMMDALRRV